MEVFGTVIKQKLSKKYCCEICDYNTDRKSNLENHLNSAKHLKEINGSKIKQTLSNNNLVCEICHKIYQTSAGLWKHKTKNNCKHDNDECKKDIDDLKISDNEFTNKDLIMMLIKENSELKTIMMEQQSMMIKVLENGASNNNSHNTTNSHNKAFNLNLFLNETCKDAMNINDFVESIKLQVSDLENVGEVGFVEGISNIIVKNLNALDITKRPIHCTDKKREIIYIKDENVWEKDESQCKMRKAIKKVVSKNQRLIPKFKEQNPEYNKSYSKVSDKYNKLIIESMGGSGDNDAEKEDKIVRNIVKNVLVNKSV
jgi:hypothetical protein